MTRTTLTILCLTIALAPRARAADRVPFHEGVLAALSRHGCSAGACHGSPTGKGGFRLSLRGFDPAADAVTLIREDFGRRVNPTDPESSLLLLKPLMQVAHGGGQKLRKTDPAYTILRDWIAQGARPDSPGTPASQSIKVEVASRELQLPAQPQQLTVVGKFTDGSQRELTHLAVFSSSDESVAHVSETGLVTAVGRGEATILVRYLDHIDTVPFTFLEDVPGFAWTNPPANNFIDDLVFSKLQKLQIAPADLCADHEFIRRVQLDVLGTLPTRGEVEAFVADASPDKRNLLIDKLLARPEYAERMAQRWADLLRVKGARLGVPAAFKLHRWLVEAMQRDLPYDQLVRTLLTAEGSTLANPPAGFFRAAAETNDCAEATAQLFLGARIQCAKCHNHPFDRWSQDEYHALGAFFARIQRKATATDGEMVIFLSPSGEKIQPRTNQVIPPSVPAGIGADATWSAGPQRTSNADASAERMSGRDGRTTLDRRVALADWLASPDNRLFAKVGANRLWGWLFGRGIVEPVDDLRDSNPPSNGPLLDALAEEFVAGKFSQKHLLRLILRSRTYQLWSRSNSYHERNVKYFSQYPAHLLPAEQLLDAISQVTGVAEEFPGLPAGTRAGELPLPEMGGHFLRIFGQPGRETVCDCERTKEPKLSQPLTLLSGTLIPAKLRDPRSRLAKHLALAADPAADEAFLIDFCESAFSRPPTADELANFRQHLANAADRAAGFEDICWAVLNAKEFLFQR